MKRPELLKSPDDGEYHRQNDAEEDHGRNGEVKPEIFFFNTDIARQPPDPVKLVVEKIDNNAYYYEGNANNYDIFSRLRIHRKRY